MQNTSMMTATIRVSAFSMVLMLIGTMVLLMVKYSNRRIRHRAELAEMRLQRDQEVMAAEREATQHTLREVGRELHDNVGAIAHRGADGLEHRVGGGGVGPTPGRRT